MVLIDKIFLNILIKTLAIIVIKINKGFAAILAFISVWLIFSILYLNIANDSNGKEYIIHDELNYDIIIDRFKKDLNINIYNRKEDYLFKSTMKQILKDNPTGLISYENYSVDGKYVAQLWPIDKNWVDVFITLLDSYDHFSITNAKKVEGSENLFEYRIKFWRIRNPLDTDLYNIDLPLNKKNEFIESGEYFFIREKIHSDYLSVADKLYSINYDIDRIRDFIANSKSNIGGYGVFNEHSVYYYLEKSINNMAGFYPEEKIHGYELADFLYFSAATISTLGYGDILPLSNRVRACVIIETILGIIILSLFVTFLIGKKDPSGNSTKIYIIDRLKKLTRTRYRTKIAALILFVLIFIKVFISVIDLSSSLLGYILPDSAIIKLSYMSDSLSEVFNSPSDILSDSSEVYMTITPARKVINPNQIISMKAISENGIHHIGYSWDNKRPKHLYKSSYTITPPGDPGVHTLYYYAKDSSPNYNFTGWQKQEFYIDPKAKLCGVEIISYAIAFVLLASYLSYVLIKKI